MLTNNEAETLLDELFEQEALVIGGLVALHGMDDKVLCSLMRSLDDLRTSFRQRIAARAAKAADAQAAPLPKPHPAIQRFLHKLRS
ncbi:MAG: hypothetical protein NTW87_00725 [Planctomycetota bacterium]|nr:hypothetical protein [Planctomycetota bacterium]